MPTEESKTKDLGLIKSRGQGQVMERGEEATLLSLLGEDILINNPRSKIREADLGKIRYFYKIPKLVEI